MAHSYQSAYPSDASVDPEIVQFIEKFYTTSDDPDALDNYVDLFEKDATFILASKKSIGHDGMLVESVGGAENTKSLGRNPGDEKRNVGRCRCEKAYDSKSLSLHQRIG